MQGVLGIFQKLVASKSHDQEGFRIMEALVKYLPSEVMQPYMPTVRSSPPITMLDERPRSMRTIESRMIKWIVERCFVRPQDHCSFIPTGLVTAIPAAAECQDVPLCTRAPGVPVALHCAARAKRAGGQHGCSAAWHPAGAAAAGVAAQHGFRQGRDSGEAARCCDN